MADDPEGVKILVVREIVSRCSFAHVVQHKGVQDNGYAVACLVKDVEWLGVTKLMLRSDNEPAITKLLTETLKTLRVEVPDIDQVAEEHPPERDPQANGAIESTVGGFKGLLRTYILALETRLGHRVPPEHPVVSWLVQHTAHLMTIRIKGEDGKTAYERVRMRPFSTRMMEFAELCRYRLDPKDMMSNGTLASRWGTGIFLGMCRTTGRYQLWTNDGVIASRSVLRMPEIQKWDQERVATVAIRPFQLHTPADELRVASRLYIKRSEIDAFGYCE